MRIEKEPGEERQRVSLHDLQEKLDQETILTKRVESGLRIELGLS